MVKSHFDQGRVARRAWCTFFWGAFVHMATPIGTMGFSRDCRSTGSRPSGRRAQGSRARGRVSTSSLAGTWGQAMSDTEEKEWEAKLGPRGRPG